MAVDPTQIELTPAQRRRLALLAEQTGREWTVLVDELLDAAPVALGAHSAGVSQENVHAGAEQSLCDVLADRGILGCFDGPADLSTNPEYREGFGEPRHSKNPD